MIRLLIFFDKKFLICRPLIIKKPHGIDRNFESIIVTGFEFIIKNIRPKYYYYFLQKIKVRQKKRNMIL